LERTMVNAAISAHGSAFMDIPGCSAQVYEIFKLFRYQNHVAMAGQTG
jgi:hypothetical protein